MTPRSPSVHVGAVALLTASVCFAQSQISSGDLAGVVSDASGGRVSHAKITATNSATGLNRSAETDENGAYRIALLPPGVYRVRVEAPGFSTSVFESVPVTVGGSVVLPVELAVGNVA